MARIFAGGTDRITITDPGIGSVLDFTNGDVIAFSLWLYRTTASATEQTYIGKRSSGNVTNYVIGTDSGAQNLKIRFYYRNTSSVFQIWRCTNDVASANAWVHAALSYTFGTGSTMSLYVDGNSEAGSWISGDGDTAPNEDDTALELGNHGIGGEPFIGRMGPLLIYKNPGVDAQFLANNRYSAFRFLNGLVWAGALGLGSPEPDLSGNGNSGVLTGTTIGDNPPVSPLFGFDTGWQGGVAAAVGATWGKLLGQHRNRLVIV